MGVLDLKIEIETGYRWGIRNQRLERIKSKPVTYTSTQPHTNDPSSSVSAIPSETVEYMSLQLYRAAAEEDVDKLVGVLEQISAEKGQSFSEILEQVTPSGNTLLHVSVTHEQEMNVSLIAYHAPFLYMKQNAVGDTALHIAARAGYSSIHNTLLWFLEDSGDPDFGGLWIAAQRGMPDKRMLLRIKNVKGNTALHECVTKRYDSSCRHVASSDPLNRLVSSDSDKFEMTSRSWDCFWLMKADPAICYIPNNEGKSPLYLAAEAGERKCVDLMLSITKEIRNTADMTRGKSPLVPAIDTRNKGLMDLILSKEPVYTNLPDEQGRTPLHHAAASGFIDIVQYLLGKDAGCSLKKDSDGFFPIHTAAAHGHTQVMKELLSHCPHPREMLTSSGQSILHIAAARGKQDVVCFLLKTPSLECLINEEDHYGNTPFHLAVTNWQTKTVSKMTWDKRIDKGTINNEGFTALDAAEYSIKNSASFKKRMTWTVLKAANAPHAPRNKVVNLKVLDSSLSQRSPTEDYRDRVNTLLLVATLVATVTFAAGFTMPGGYSSSNTNAGMATMLQRRAFHVFIFSDTIAMYSSILVVICLIWAQLGDLNLVFIALQMAIPLLGVGLAMMSLAFVAGVYLVVSQLHWLTYAVLVMGSAFFAGLLILFLPLCFTISSGNRILRYVTHLRFITYYPCKLFILLFA